MLSLGKDVIEEVGSLIDQSDAVLVGSGAGLTAAAGFNYFDQDAFLQVFPGWAKKGFHMQYQLMGYSNWTQKEQWGYLKVHLEHVYFNEESNFLYNSLYSLVKSKDYFVLTSNVDGLFYKNGFSKSRIYAPQGDYGKIQCSRPCSDEVWDVRPFLDQMNDHFDPVEQVLTDDCAVPRCPNCGADMFMHVCVDESFVDSIHQEERQNYHNWLGKVRDKKLLVLDLGSGFNTPSVIRLPLEKIACDFPMATMARVNLEHFELPKELDGRGIGVMGDIRQLITSLEKRKVSTLGH